MSVVDAAGFAMAPSEDLMAGCADVQPETALRNGHQSASRAMVPATVKPAETTLHIEAWVLWLRDLFGPWSGRAAA